MSSPDFSFTQLPDLYGFVSFIDFHMQQLDGDKLIDLKLRWLFESNSLIVQLSHYIFEILYLYHN